MRENEGEGEMATGAEGISYRAVGEGEGGGGVQLPAAKTAAGRARDLLHDPRPGGADANKGAGWTGKG